MGDVNEVWKREPGTETRSEAGSTAAARGSGRIFSGRRGGSSPRGHSRVSQPFDPYCVCSSARIVYVHTERGEVTYTIEAGLCMYIQKKCYIHLFRLQVIDLKVHHKKVYVNCRKSGHTHTLEKSIGGQLADMFAMLDYKGVISKKVVSAAPIHTAMKKAENFH